MHTFQSLKVPHSACEDAGSSYGSNCVASSTVEWEMSLSEEVIPPKRNGIEKQFGNADRDNDLLLGNWCTFQNTMET